MRVVARREEAQAERRRQEVPRLEAEVAAIGVDVHDFLDERVVVVHLDEGPRHDPVEARSRGEPQQKLVEAPSRGRMRESGIVVARNHDGREGSDGDRSAQRLIANVDPVVLKRPVVLAVVGRQDDAVDGMAGSLCGRLPW